MWQKVAQCQLTLTFKKGTGQGQCQAEVLITFTTYCLNNLYSTNTIINIYLNWNAFKRFFRILSSSRHLSKQIYQSRTNIKLKQWRNSVITCSLMRCKSSKFLRKLVINRIFLFCLKIDVSWHLVWERVARRHSVNTSRQVIGSITVAMCASDLFTQCLLMENYYHLVNV